MPFRNAFLFPGIRVLQCILLKVALLVGVEVHYGVSFINYLEPPESDSSLNTGWRADVHPSDHHVSSYEFDVLIGADGRRNTLPGFQRKVFRGMLAIVRRRRAPAQRTKYFR